MNSANSWTVQLNDTHPAIAVAELMRLLVDEHHVPWEQAWSITQQVFCYTNHTLLPEALEKWSLSLFASVLPRHLEIIFEINRRFLDEVRLKYPGDDSQTSPDSPSLMKMMVNMCAWLIWPASAARPSTVWQQCTLNF